METHKAMLANVIKYLGPGLLEEDLECLVVPGVTTGQVEVALERVYTHFDTKPIWKLLKDQRQDPEPELGVCNEEGQSQLAPLPLQIQQDQDPIVTDHCEVDTVEVEDQRQDPEPELEACNNPQEQDGEDMVI